jgi:nesprin-1
LKEGISNAQEDLVRLGLLPANEAERVGQLQNRARRLELSVSDELERGIALRERLAMLRKGLSRVKRDQARASAVLDQCQSCIDQSNQDVQQALDKCNVCINLLLKHQLIYSNLKFISTFIFKQGVIKTVGEQWTELMSLRQVLHGLPAGLRVSVSPVLAERELSRLQDEQGVVEERARVLLEKLSNRNQLWTDYTLKLDSVKQSARNADYMMQLLKLQGNVDYQRLVKATERLKVS